MLRKRADDSRRDATLIARRIERVSLGRLAAAALIVLAAAAAIAEPHHRGVFVPGVALAIAGFAFLVRRSRRLDTLRRRALGRAAVSEQGAFRAERLWSRIDPQPWTWPRDDGEHQRIDLDVVGTESLVQLLPSMSAAGGAPRIRQWFATLADEDAVRARQASVRELVDAVELRDAFELVARRLRLTEERIDGFVAWGRASGRPEPKWLSVASRALPALSLAGIATSAVWRPAAAVAVASVFTTAVLAMLVRARFRDTMLVAEAGARIAEAYAELAGQVRRARLETPLLRELQGALVGGSTTAADAALLRLQRLAAWAEVRSSPMLHAALQAILAWDCQIARAVEGWRSSHGASLAAWFSALAETECLAALAGLAYTNPTWVFPEIAPELPLRVRARGLGHPLLADGARVPNDVEIGPAGTVLLISGSNMSGKSTLLRAIGLNALLARVGGPVCAEAMWCPPMRLFTSLRTQDSLADGVSYFMAEALRLRDIVFAAEASTDDAAPPVLYLVDEILRGTNSQERAVASRFIVGRLLKTSAIGAITTHDLEVFNVPEIADHAAHAHFSEHFTGAGGDERLIFDYRLRPGPTTSRNALRLLSLIGLTRA
ncbi:MAG: MutS-related protein [Gemmatimonadaceae bacterium]